MRGHVPVQRRAKAFMANSSNAAADRLGKTAFKTRCKCLDAAVHGNFMRIHSFLLAIRCICVPDLINLTHRVPDALPPSHTPKDALTRTEKSCLLI